MLCETSHGGQALQDVHIRWLRLHPVVKYSDTTHHICKHLAARHGCLFAQPGSIGHETA